MSETSLLDRLAAEFPKSEVRQRAGGGGIKLDYIDVVQTINRLTDVLQADWDWKVLDAKVELVETGNGATYLAQERGELHVWLPDSDRPVIRGGAGADTDPRDPDKAIKTADAEALKKAGHKFGIALYLWDEGKRNEIAKYRQLERGTPNAIKQAALLKANAKTPAELLRVINETFDLDDHSSYSEADLQNKDLLLEFLAAA